MQQLKKTTLSTKLCDLYDKDEYYLHIEVDREYWYYFTTESNIAKKYGSGWYKIKITYIRSGCLFYIFPDYKDIDEDFCPLKCFMTSQFEFAEINPKKDLDIKDNSFLLYRFDDTRTVVIDWDNSLTYTSDNPIDILISLAKN